MMNDQGLYNVGLKPSYYTSPIPNYDILFFRTIMSATSYSRFISPFVKRFCSFF